MDIGYSVHRVEDRTNPDGVDFWDFLTKEMAEDFINKIKKEDLKPRKYSVRELSEEETISLALAFYYNTIKR